MSRKVVCLCHAVVMLGLFAVQAIQLDCDPAPLKPMSNVADEGLWNHNAQSKATLWQLRADDLSLALVAAPLFTAAQWLVFSACGVSYFSARLICLVSLWLVMLMVYYLMGRQFSWGAGLLAAATLGVAQEMLMYTKWATPVMLEMMFLTAVLFFWELGRTGSRRWMAVSGACFIAALLSKMTSLQVVPALAVFLAGSCWLRKTSICGGCCTSFSARACSASLSDCAICPSSSPGPSSRGTSGRTCGISTIPTRRNWAAGSFTSGSSRR